MFGTTEPRRAALARVDRILTRITPPPWRYMAYGVGHEVAAMPNRLAGASSPYLRSHADNPVDWWPWGPEPFAEAARRDVPVMVSIGYSTCHWCHVMARESFSDPEIAALLNDRFVAIKVDREEHLEVDAAYLAAASAFTQNLGWPLTSFTTPQGRTFFAGTYWPPTAVQGDACVPRCARGRARCVGGPAFACGGDRRRSSARRSRGPRPPLRASVDLDAAVARLAELEDPQFGGFGYAPAFAPKFPNAPALAVPARAR